MSKHDIIEIDEVEKNSHIIMTDFIIKTIELIIHAENDVEKKRFLIENLKARINEIENG
jgi:hypothetical protein